MKNITLGTTGIPISELGMGCIQITRLSRKESTHLIREVHDLGVTWFDTAQGYIDSEERLGEALSGIREDVVIITKSTAADKKILEQHIEESLTKLRTDYIDVFFFHGAAALDEPAFDASGGLLETVESFVQEGKIQHLGFSTHKPALGMKALEYEQLKVGMVPANYINREFIDGTFMEEARKKSLALLAMKPFGGGRLISPGPSLRFLKTYPGIIPCIGIEMVEEMEENIAIWEESAPFSEEDRNFLENQKSLLGEKFCRMCRYCLPCPEGIPIPTVNFLKVFSMQMPLDKVITEEHDAAVKKAEECTECRQCVARCPYDLEIPEMLKEGIEFYREFKKANT